MVQGGKIVLAYPKLLRDAGFAEGELVAFGVLDILLRANRRSVKRVAMAMLRGASQTSYDFRVILKTSEVHWLTGTMAPIKCEERPPTFAFCMNVTTPQDNELSLANQAQQSCVIAEIGRVIRSSLNIDQVYRRCAEEVRRLVTFNLDSYRRDRSRPGLTDQRLRGWDLGYRQATGHYHAGGQFHHTRGAAHARAQR